jgi:hypothetical protein
MKKKSMFATLFGLYLIHSQYSVAGYVVMDPLPTPQVVYQQRVFPRMVLIPGYPVYYAPNISLNLFFYDGVYWSFFNDQWYMSSWYNGPWVPVTPINVPYYLLSIPVGFYVNPPAYFHTWRPNERPHWDEHWRGEWGERWEDKSREFRQWRPTTNLSPAPLPSYQQNYKGNLYPQRIEEQRSLHQNNYNYQPREPVVQQHFNNPPTINPSPDRGQMTRQPDRMPPHQGGGDHR